MNTRKTKKIVFNFFRIIILAMFLLFAVLPLFGYSSQALKATKNYMRCQ
jgi:ABC-type glycerol-3-phosphate transport system permease component